MNIHPHQLRALVRDRVEEIQRAVDRPRCATEIRRRVSVRRRSGGSEGRPVTWPKNAQDLLRALEDSLREGL